jgi:Protein of unknown function (DUF2917)
MACDGYTNIWDLAPGELVQLDGARGTTLRVTRGTLWVTLENDLRDVVLSAGDSFMVDRGGLTIIEAQGKTTVCVLARHVTELRRRGTVLGLAGRLAAWWAGLGAAGQRPAPYRSVPYL